MARILRIGLPGSGQMLSRSLMGLAFMHLVAGFGTPAVAAYGTGLRLLMVLLMPAFALGGGAATMVGQNLGAGQPERARRAAWLAAGLDVAFMAVAAAALVAFAGPLIGLFNRDPAVVAEGTRYLRIVAPSFVFAALAIVLGRALGGAGDTFWPMVFTVASLWGLQVPLAWLWARVLWRTIDGVWWAMVAATLVHGLLVAAWFETGRWQRQRV
jgi:Na+-driven multidrug efflux pump